MALGDPMEASACEQEAGVRSGYRYRAAAVVLRSKTFAPPGVSAFRPFEITHNRRSAFAPSRRRSPRVFLSKFPNTRPSCPQLTLQQPGAARTVLAVDGADCHRQRHQPKHGDEPSAHPQQQHELRRAARRGIDAATLPSELQ
eukprot:4870669-Pleurochrysis_carterae.AAC.3